MTTNDEFELRPADGWGLDRIAWDEEDDEQAFDPENLPPAPREDPRY
jgi:hypothetical protein